MHQQGRTNGSRATDLLELLDDRVGSGATIVAGQMPVKDWHAFIHDPALADATLTDSSIAVISWR